MPPALPFLQAVGVDASQGFDQHGLTLIDVIGGAKDRGFHCYEQQ